MNKVFWYLFVSGVILSGLVSCKSTKGDSTGAPVRYTVIVSDQSDVPLGFANVALYTETDESYSETTNDQGRAIFEVESEINQFSVSRGGYWDLDTIDQVPQPTDSTEQGKTIFRIIRIHLEKIADPTLESSSVNLSSSQSVLSSSSAE